MTNTNIATINTKQHRGANNKKLKLETLVILMVQNNRQVIIHIINCLRKKGGKSFKKG